MYSRLTAALALIGLLLVGLVGTLLPEPAVAATGINPMINFQGRLFDDTGAVVADGTYNMQFKMYQDGDGVLGGGDETLEWTEDWLNVNSQGVMVRNGYLSVRLGAVNAFGSSVDWAQDTLWLSLNIGDTTSAASFAAANPDGEMTPFRRLTTAVYALQLQNTHNLGGIAASGFIQNVSPAAAQQTANINILSGAATTVAAAQIQTVASATAPVLILKGGATPGAGADLLQLQNSSGTALARVDSAGNLRVAASIDTQASGTLDIGTDTANTAITLGRSGITTTNPGTATVTQLLTADGGITVSPNQNLILVAGSGTYTQTYSGTGSAAFMIANASLTSGGLLSVNSSSVGLTGDLAKLEATGNNAGVTGTTLKVGMTGASATGTALNVTNAGSGLVARFNDDGTYADSTPIVFDADGELGVGTAAPSSLIHVVGTSSPKVRIQSTGANGGIMQLDGTGGSWQIYAQGTGFRFYDSDDRMTILSSGNVGIGTTGATGLLAVGPNSEFRVSSTGAVTAVGVNAGAGLLQGQLGLTVSGADTNINSGSGAGFNFATNINTGTSNGAVSIGNSAAGAIALQSASSINLTAAAASTITTGAASLTLTSSNFNVSNVGVVTLAGAQTRDITTAGSASAVTAITLQPGILSLANGTGSNATIKAGDEDSTTCGTACTGGVLALQGGSATGGVGTTNGGAVTINGGTGTTNGGAVNIGNTVLGNINIGTVAGTKTIQIGATTGTGTHTIGIGNNATSGSVTDITIGNLLGASTTTLQAGTNHLNLKSGGNIVLGTSDTTGTLLVVDKKTSSGAPTGVNGAIYYNSGGEGGAEDATSATTRSGGKFRCFEGNKWKNCVGMRDMVERRWGLWAPDNGTGTPTAEGLGSFGFMDSVAAFVSTNGSGAATITADPNTEGYYIKYVTGTASGVNDDVELCNCAGGNPPVPSGDSTRPNRNPRLYARIRTDDSLVSSTNLWVSMTDKSTRGTATTTAENLIGLQYSTGGTYTTSWACSMHNQTTNPNTDLTPVNTGVTVSANTYYDIILDYDNAAGILTCSVATNGGAYVTVTNSGAPFGSSPNSNVISGTVDLSTMVTIRELTGGTGTRSFSLAYLYLEQN